MSYILDTPMQDISIFLRSSDATSFNSSSKDELIYDLNQSIHSYPNMELLVCLQSFSFTNSFYTINENNNKFNYTFNNTNVITVEFAYGNYTIDDLMIYANQLFINTFVFSYSLITLKITITSQSNFRLVSIETQNKNNIYELLGFDDVISYTTLSKSYTSPYLFNMMSVQQINVCATNLNVQSIGLKNRSKYNILNTIQITSMAGETQHYENNTSFKYKLSDSSISSLSIKILNQDFQPISFNNIDYFLNITFSYIYVKPFIYSEYLINDNTARLTILNKEKNDLINDVENNFVNI